MMKIKMILLILMEVWLANENNLPKNIIYTVEDSVEIRINDYKTGISHTGFSGEFLFVSLKL